MYTMPTIKVISKLHLKLWKLSSLQVVFLQEPDSQIHFTDTETMFLEKSSKNCGLVPVVWTDLWHERIEPKEGQGVLSSS